MEKTIHVDAYTRSDGTYVREHERHLDSNSDFQNFGDENPGLFDNLKEILAQSKSRENELLEELSQIGKGNQADLLKEYAELKEKNLNDEHTLRIIEYMQSIGMKDAKKAKEMLDNIASTVDNRPHILKDAVRFWDISSHGLENDKSAVYVANNCKFYSQINKLPVEPAVQKAVRNKVRQQLNRDNSVGIIFHKDSNVAQKIAKDADFNNIIKQNFSKLYKGEHINTSMRFNLLKAPNLYFAFGNVDILDLHINNEGNFEAYVLDTYDFNEGSSNWFVQKGRLAQEKGLINNYYTLVKVIK